MKKFIVLQCQRAKSSVSNLNYNNCFLRLRLAIRNHIVFPNSEIEPIIMLQRVLEVACDLFSGVFEYKDNDDKTLTHALLTKSLQESSKILVCRDPTMKQRFSSLYS